VPLVDEKLSLPLSELSPRQSVTNTAWGRMSYEAPPFLDGILVPLVDEKLSLPFSELSPRHSVMNTAWGFGACLAKLSNFPTAF
jgi:hypothetical protein